MPIKRKLFLSIFILLLSFELGFAKFLLNIDEKSPYELEIEYYTDINSGLQVFYKSGNQVWNEENSKVLQYSNNGSLQTLVMTIPYDTREIRIDFEESIRKHYLNKISIGKVTDKQIDLNNLALTETNNLEIISNNKMISVIATNSDPYLAINIDSEISDLKYYNSRLVLIYNLLISFGLSLYTYFMLSSIRQCISFIKLSIRNLSLIYQMAKNDFKVKYSNSAFGVAWGFVNPLVLILTYWFVFEVGLRSSSVSTVPFIVWLVTGIVPWFYFSEAVLSGTNSLIEYNYLVKKMSFKIELLPIVKALSALFIHIFFVIFVILICIFYKIKVDVYFLQIIYYSFSLVVLSIAISLATCSVVVFVRDVLQLIAIVLNIGFWFTPIIWSEAMIPDSLRMLFIANPMYYIVSGFRDTVINKVWFYEKPFLTIYFWLITSLILLIGSKLLDKLKDHFADVL